MLAGVLLSLTAVLPLSNFLVNIVTSRGGTDADLGLAMFVMGAFELPTAFLFPKLLRRFGSGRLLLISAVFGTLKAVALLCTFNYAGVLLAGWTLDMGDANWMFSSPFPNRGMVHDICGFCKHTERLDTRWRDKSMNMRKTKIICTLGPAVDHAETIERLIRPHERCPLPTLSRQPRRAVGPAEYVQEGVDTLGAPGYPFWTPRAPKSV